MCLCAVARSAGIAFETGIIVQRMELWFLHHCVCVLLGLLLYSAGWSVCAAIQLKALLDQVLWACQCDGLLCERICALLRAHG
jgi:hypothetical protein